MSLRRSFSSPIEFLLEKAKRGEIDPEDINVKDLVEEFKKQVERLSGFELFHQAGAFLQAISSLLKLKVEKLLNFDTKEEKKKKIKLQEVIEVLKQEEEEEEIGDDLEWLWDYKVRAGRPQGSRDTQARESLAQMEKVPLYGEFKIEQYRKVLEEFGLYEFEDFEKWLAKIQDRVERVRFFMAWLDM